MSESPQFEIHNTPEQTVSIEQVGDDPIVTYHIDWREQGHPSPKMLQDLSEMQVTLAVLGNYVLEDDEFKDEYKAAFEAVSDLFHAMVDQRALDGEVEQEVLMGNFDALPEVIEREVS